MEEEVRDSAEADDEVSAARIDQNHDQPCVWFSQTTMAGAVMSATIVAARVRRRHWTASSLDCSLRWKPVSVSASEATL